eukprot:CAMPEP_0183380284 /NCGR_PEP_ID=MMETSP0164_2-20130417/125856_1 /TAXON_ID=221442 /ORGANISM="Coccolithus pelagicus ssp braarudi, Strain PLY182g" /LENGTH=458 /DNA_ID=CAMNT_0025557881 /DNA_START=5 /DNA_END=1381 /DNA_ORIENTATION=+
MGCCSSKEDVAAETDLPAPEWGQPIKCRLAKKGWMSSDYNIWAADPNAEEEGKEVKWMLMDAAGSWLDDGYCYYLKHRASGQVDENGDPISTVLGSVNIRGDWDAFSFRICGADRDTDIGPFFDLWDGDFDWGISNEEALWAVWTFSKRAVIYSDYEMETQIGWLDITGSGTWYEKEETRVIHDTDEDGHDHVRYEKYRHTDCKVNGFRYKFNVHNTPMVISYNRQGGGFFKAAKLTFTAAAAFAPEVPLFVATGDGENNCTIETFQNSDPVSTLLAAYAISCKLDPKDFKQGAESKCERAMHLGMWPGTSNFIGMPEQDFEARFTKYTAPVPAVFAQAVASYVPQLGPPMAIVSQPGQAVAQPMMVQPMMMEQPMMAQPMAQPMMAQPMMAQPMMAQPMSQPMAQPVQPTSQSFAVVVPEGAEPGQQIMVQSPYTGQQVMVAIPQGVRTGMQFQVQA